MAEAAVEQHRHRKESVTSCDTQHTRLEEFPHRQDMGWKWDAKEGGNDAILESDEEVDEAWRCRAGGAPMVGKVDGGQGVSPGLDLKSRDKSIGGDDGDGKGWTQPPGKVLTSEWEEAARNNEWMEVEREQRGSWAKRCFAYFCHLGMGFFASTTETRPVEHLFHMMRFQTAAIPKGADSLILALIEKRVFFFTPFSVGELSGWWELKKREDLEGIGTQWPRWYILNKLLRYKHSISENKHRYMFLISIKAMEIIMNSVWNQGKWSRIVSWQHIYMCNNWFINPRISDFESDCKRKQEKRALELTAPLPSSLLTYWLRSCMKTHTPTRLIFNPAANNPALLFLSLSLCRKKVC